ncbi:MAG: tetratricopeptide repeat protein [Planctomycetes bacterium]|nr:tetratricopeptide repeat protein [Planctomycetota bacterium]MCB9892107.1 tetratricopeptide repeat protein [Planctomycetota bacterium]
MDAEKYELLCTLFLELCEAPSEERERHLQRIEHDDAELHEELVRMIREDQAPRLDLASPAGSLDVGLLHPSRDHELPDKVGRYEVRGRLGSGGMGVVFRGYDPTLDRDVALKVLRSRLEGRAEWLQRFTEEARIGGRLQHPGIVPVYEYDRDDHDRPFFTMKLIEGETLGDLLGKKRDVTSALEIFERVCHTVAYAHSRGVVHRDLKPNNVLVGSFGEVQVLDWGLAQDVDEFGERRDAVQSDGSSKERSQPPSSSYTGSAMGTPAYMPPEQACGALDEIGQRSDVFSLGAILCEILTGEPPYREALGDVLDQARVGRLEDASNRLASLAEETELARLAQRCLETDPAKRPADAGELARTIATHRHAVTERVRDAERQAAIAEGKAVSERRARKRTAFLSACILLALVVAGILFFEREHDRRQRRLEEERDVAAAREAQGERRRRARIDTIESLREPTPEATTSREAQAVHRSFSAFFASQGVDVLDGDVDRVLQQLRTWNVTATLIAGLDHWALAIAYTRGQVPRVHVERLLQLSTALDEDSDRAGIRQGILNGTLAGVEDTTTFETIRTWPAPSIDLLGNALQSLGRFDEALAVLELGRRVHPEDYWLQLRCGIVLLNQSTPALGPSIECFEAAVALRPGSARTRAQLGMVLRGLGRWREAESVYRAANAVDPENGHWVYHVAECLWNQGESESAALTFERAAELNRSSREVDSRSHDARLGLVKAMISAGRLERAREVLRDAQQNPRRSVEPEEHAKQRVELAQLWGACGAPDRATAVLTQFLEESPSNVDAWITRADLASQQGDPNAAIAFYERALALDDGRASVHHALAVVLQRQGRDEDAEEHFLEALRLAPDDVVTLSNYGAFLARRGRPQALGVLVRALARDPEYAQANHALAGVLMNRGDHATAVVHLQRAVHTEPDNANYQMLLGTALRNVGRTAEAAETLERAVSLDDTHVDAHFYLGSVRRSRGELQAAERSYRRVLELAPEHAQAMCNLAESLSMQARYAEALTWYRRGHELGTQQPNWRYPSAQWLARAEERHRFEEAIEAFESDTPVELTRKQALRLANFCWSAAADLCRARTLEAHEPLRWLARSARLWWFALRVPS